MSTEYAGANTVISDTISTNLRVHYYYLVLVGSAANVLLNNNSKLHAGLPPGNTL